MTDIYGRRVSLANYLGQNVLLTFNRAAVCPLCNLRTWHLIRRYPAYQRAGLEVIAFFESSPERAHYYLDRQRAPYPIIADLSHNVYDRYGLGASLWGSLVTIFTKRAMRREAKSRGVGVGLVENITRMDGHMGRLPGDFLIEPDGRIRLAYYGRDAGDFLLFSDLERAAFGAPLPESSLNLPLGSRL